MDGPGLIPAPGCPKHRVPDAIRPRLPGCVCTYPAKVGGIEQTRSGQVWPAPVILRKHDEHLPAAPPRPRYALVMEMAETARWRCVHTPIRAPRCVARRRSRARWGDGDVGRKGKALAVRVPEFDVRPDSNCDVQGVEPGVLSRVHRAHIVNLDHVSAIRPHDERRLAVRFADGSEVVSSRAGSQPLREMAR